METTYLEFPRKWSKAILYEGVSDARVFLDGKHVATVASVDPEPTSGQVTLTLDKVIFNTISLDQRIPLELWPSKGPKFKLSCQITGVWSVAVLNVVELP